MMTTETILRTLGQLVRALWPRGDVPLSLHDAATVQPATALGIIRRRIDRSGRNDDADIQAMMDKLPAGLTDPTGGIPVERQSAYWLGYYQYMAARQRAADHSPDEFAAVGEALYGRQWVAPLAEDLDVNPRRLREWRSGRRMPASVWADLAALLASRGQRIDRLLTNIAEK